MKSIAASSILILVLVLGAESRSDDESSSEPPVAAVEVKGLRTMSREDFLGRLETRVGRPFSERAVDRDVRRLYATGRFFNISWRKEPADEGIKVVFTVIENQTIESVAFRGAKVFGESKLLSKIKSVPGTYLSDYHLHLDSREISSLYRQEGYHSVNVSHEVLAAEQGGALLVFIIREGNRVVLDSVEFSGNNRFDDSYLRAQMSMVERAWYHDLLGSKDGLYERKSLLVDVERLKAFYRGQGFWDAGVWLEGVEYSADGRHVTVRIRVEEGSPYIVRSVSISGNKVISNAELEPLLLAMPGEPALAEFMDGDARTIRSAYGERAFLDAKVTVKKKTEEQGNEADIVYEVTEGSKTMLGLLEIRGNTRTRDRVIRRHVRLSPGEEVNTKLLQRGLRRIQGLGYFDSLGYEFLPGKEEGESDLVITVQEGRTGEIRFGGAYSGEHGIIGMLQYTQRNFDPWNPPEGFEDFIEGRAFAGGGQFFQISLKPGTTVRRYALAYKNPYVYDWPLQFGFSASNWSRDYNDYAQERTGGTISLARKFEDADFEVGAAFRFEQINIDDVEPDAPDEIIETEGTSHLITLSPSFGWDKRDNALNPTEGWKAVFEYEYGGTLLGGDYDFSKVNLTGEYHINLYERLRGGAHVLSLTSELGWVEEQGDSDEVPFFERYYAGGLGSLRGFDFHGIGPRENDVAIGGSVRALGSAEYSFPLYGVEKLGQHTDILRGVLFVDTGNVAEDFSVLHADEFRLSVGAGIRIYATGPVPFALYFAVPLLEEDEDERESFHFSIGMF